MSQDITNLYKNIKIFILTYAADQELGSWMEKRDGGEDLSLHEIVAEFGYKRYVIPCILVCCVKTVWRL